MTPYEERDLMISTAAQWQARAIKAEQEVEQLKGLLDYQSQMLAELPPSVDELLASQMDAAVATAEAAVLRSLLSEVYESQTAACIGNGGPCEQCLWCRVRAAIRAGDDA